MKKIILTAILAGSAVFAFAGNVSVNLGGIGVSVGSSRHGTDVGVSIGTPVYCPPVVAVTPLSPPPPPPVVYVPPVWYPAPPVYRPAPPPGGDPADRAGDRDLAAEKSLTPSGRGTIRARIGCCLT